MDLFDLSQPIYHCACAARRTWYKRTVIPETASHSVRKSVEDGSVNTNLLFQFSQHLRFVTARKNFYSCIKQFCSEVYGILLALQIFYCEKGFKKNKFIPQLVKATDI